MKKTYAKHTKRIGGMEPGDITDKLQTAAQETDEGGLPESSYTEIHIAFALAEDRAAVDGLEDGRQVV